MEQRPEYAVLSRSGRGASGSRHVSHVVPFRVRDSFATLHPHATLVSRLTLSGSMSPVSVEDPSGRPSVRTTRDQRVVMTLLLVAVVVMIVLASLSVRATMRHDAVRQRVGGSLNRASLVQMEFHSRHRRFALWDELSEGGMRLPMGLSVEASTASSSHWYMRVRDVESGTMCDRIGMLTDPPGRPIAPSCQRPD